ncbi:MAG: PD-(D/E)XK nuclease family protein [Armatimonadota bacterium]|nr:PD-(D/E)XK nuclease family protein [Armatimonadota bacterium]
MILCGPAGSGKTDLVLDEYVATIRAHGEDAALLLLPTRLACERVRRRLVDEGTVSGLLDARIYDFRGLAEVILEANHEQVARLTDWQQTLLMRSIVRELCEAKRLPALAPMCGYPGFVDTLCELVEELKRAGADPSAFRAGIERSPLNDERSRELAAIYDAYQARLQERGLYDDAGRFWRARNVLRGEDGRQPRRRPFEDLRLILADGFADFTTTQLQVLRALAEGAERLIITLSLEPDPGRRPELFRLPRRTLDRLQEHLGDLSDGGTLPVEYIQLPGADGALPRMGDRLFLEGEVEPLEGPGDALALFEASGREMEVHQVAVRVKKLLCQGVEPSRIAVIAGDLDGYAAALEGVFAEAGVPLRLQSRAPAGGRPPVQAVLDVLRVPAERYRASDVLRLIKSSFFDGAVLGQDAPEPDEIERVCRAARIIGGRGREEWAQRLATYARRLRRELDLRTRGERDEEAQWFPGSDARLEREISTVEAVQSALSALFERLAPLEQASTLREAVEALVAVIHGIGLPDRIGMQTPDSRAEGENILAFDAFREGLRQMWAAREQLGTAGETAVREFYQDVLRMSGRVSYPLIGGPAEAVLAVDMQHARQLDFDHVFILGVTEHEFPHAWREDPLYGDRERRELRRAGVPLDPRRDQQWRDMLTFYSVVASVRQRLTLSYPTTDAEGHEVLPSYYLDEIRRCFVDDIEPVRYGLATTIPDFPDAISVRELLDRALLELYSPDMTARAGRDDEARQVLPALGARKPDLLRALAGAVAVEERREWHPADEYDARLTDEATVAHIAAELGPEHLFSAGALGDYGTCPFQFFAGRVLGLEKLEDPTEDVDALLLGSLRHRCLAEFFRRWRERRQDGRIEQQDLPEARKVMARVVDWAFEDAIRDGLVGDRAVFDISRRETHRDLRLWLDYEVAQIQSQGHTATWLEQRYGFGRFEPVVIGEGDEALRLRGRIDRVDRMERIEGRPAFAVYDYKSSSGPSLNRIDDGRDFQLPVYALAVRSSVLDDEAVCAHWGYYRVRRPVKLGRRSPSAERIEEYIQTACANARQHAARIRSGDFMPHPAGRCGFCDFDGICRWNEYRFERKGGQEDD